MPLLTDRYTEFRMGEAVRIKELDVEARDSAPSRETLAAFVPLTRDERWALVNAVTARQHVVTMLLCAGIAYLGLAIGQSGLGRARPNAAHAHDDVRAHRSVDARRSRGVALPTAARSCGRCTSPATLFLVIIATVTAAYAVERRPLDSSTSTR